MNTIEIRRPWYVALIAARSERAMVPTALEDALLAPLSPVEYS
ncbi:MAG: hypothetical protein WAK41_03185 [Roseiarcus sp.]